MGNEKWEFGKRGNELGTVDNRAKNTIIYVGTNDTSEVCELVLFT